MHHEKHDETRTDVRQLGVQSIAPQLQRLVWTILDGEPKGTDMPYIPLNTVEAKRIDGKLGLSTKLVGMLRAPAIWIELSDHLSAMGTAQIQTLAHEYTHAYLEYRYSAERAMNMFSEGRGVRVLNGTKVLEWAEEGICNAVGYYAEHMLRGSRAPMRDALADMLLGVAEMADLSSRGIIRAMNEYNISKREDWALLVEINTEMLKEIVPMLETAKAIARNKDERPEAALRKSISLISSGQAAEGMSAEISEFISRTSKFFLRKQRHAAYLLTGNKKSDFRSAAKSLAERLLTIQKEAIDLIKGTGELSA